MVTFLSCMLDMLNHLSNPKPGHTLGGTIRGGARRDGGAGRGRAAQDADGTVRPGEKQPLLPSRRWKNYLLGVPLDARTKETLCKPMEEQSPRLNRGW